MERYTMKAILIVALCVTAFVGLWFVAMATGLGT
jgi:hypothetical protein